MDARWDVGDPEVDSFVDDNIASFAAWDLVIYINRNPDMRETLPSLAALLARPEHDLVPALDRLVAAGTLVRERDEDPALTRYRPCADVVRRQVIARFVELAGVREHRLEFVRRVLSHIAQD